MSESQGYKLGMKLGLSDKSALFSKVRRDGSKREVELLMGSGSANTAFRRGLKSAAFELKQGKRRPAARQKTTRKKTTRQRLTTAKRPAAKRDVLDRSTQTEALKVLKQRYVAEGYTKRESARLAREDLNALEVYLESGIDPKTGKAPRLKDIDYPGKRKRTSSSRKSSRKDRSVAQDWNQKETTKWFATLGPKIGNFKSWDDQVYAVIGEPIKLRAAYTGGSYEDPGIVWEITQVKGEPAILQGHDSDTRGYDVVERHTGTLAQMKKKLAAISRRKRKNPRRRAGTTKSRSNRLRLNSSRPMKSRRRERAATAEYVFVFVYPDGSEDEDILVASSMDAAIEEARSRMPEYGLLEDAILYVELFEDRHRDAETEEDEWWEERDKIRAEFIRAEFGGYDNPARTPA